MKDYICPADKLVKIDIPGYMEALDDPSGETEVFDLDGKKVE